MVAEGPESVKAPLAYDPGRPRRDPCSVAHSPSPCSPSPPLPPAPGPSLRFDIELPEVVGRDMAVFAVQDGSACTRLKPADLQANSAAEVVAVMRDGAILNPASVPRLNPGDQVIVMAPEERLSGGAVANYRRKLAGALATAAQALVGTAMAWAPVNAAERQRPVGEILDVSQSFVPGYPQAYESTREVRVIE